MPRRLSALVSVVLMTGGVLTVAPASAAGESCQGRPATIVGTGPDIIGTAGDDVIVTGASRRIVAGDGADVICITPTSHLDQVVDAGPGDDVVDATSSTAVMGVTRLGLGVDRYLGGARWAVVRADGADDQVHAGIGSVNVILDLSSGVGTTDGTYDGGPTTGAISVWSRSADVELDLDEGIVVDGSPVAAVSGFRLGSVVAPRAVLTGTDRDDGLYASGCDVRVDGRGGADSINADYGDNPDEPRFDCRRDVRLSGGPGDDSIIGSKGTDRIAGGSGKDWLFGGAGADRLLGGTGSDRLRGSDGPDVLRGNGGNDVLGGTSGRDVLLGGPGRDTANGNTGSDRCVAEREQNCER